MIPPLGGTKGTGVGIHKRIMGEHLPLEGTRTRGGVGRGS